MDNLAIEIVDVTDGRSYKLSGIGNGQYSNGSLVIEAGHEYRLYFQYNGEDVTSQTTVPSAPQGVTFSGYSIGVMSFDFPESSKAPNNGIEITWNLFGWAIALNSKIKSTFGA